MSSFLASPKLRFLYYYNFELYAHLPVLQRFIYMNSLPEIVSIDANFAVMSLIKVFLNIAGILFKKLLQNIIFHYSLFVSVEKSFYKTICYIIVSDA